MKLSCVGCIESLEVVLLSCEKWRGLFCSNVLTLSQIVDGSRYMSISPFVQQYFPLW